MREFFDVILEGASCKGVILITLIDCIFELCTTVCRYSLSRRYIIMRCGGETLCLGNRDVMMPGACVVRRRRNGFSLF